MTDKNGITDDIGEITCETEAVRTRIDISKPPYNAVGDGKHLTRSAYKERLMIVILADVYTFRRVII